MAFRFKARIIDGLLFVKLKLPFGTTIVKSEVAYFSNKFVRGFLGMKQKNKRLLEYSGPAATTLQDRLKRPLTERDYFIIMEQIVDVTMTLSKEKLPWNKVNWDINAIFINETSMGIRVMYLPLEQINDNDSIVQLIDKLNDCAVIQSDKTENCVIRFRRFLNGIGVFDPSRIELFIAKEDPYAIIWIGKDIPHGVNDPPPNPLPAPEPPPTIKCPDAAEISQTGRFYLQVGFNELFALGQSAWCGAEYIPTETVEASVDASIQVVDNLGRVIANVKPSKKRSAGGSKLKQIVAIVKYLSDLAAEDNITVRPLWLDPIPAVIFVDNIERKYSHVSERFVLEPVIGEYDDPFNQRQEVLTVPLSRDGNCLVYGSTGNGKTTFLTSLCYSIIKNHTPDEVNVYLMDFGSETLKAFEKAPHVGGVILSADTEKTINFLKMIKKEAETRRMLFSEHGGDYASYIKNSGKTVPNIVVLMNNYSVFYELYEDYQDDFAILTRDGVKYGIYFVVTAGSANAVRYKVQQNFKTMLTMQLNDASDYYSIVGRTEGLVPSKFKGRGLISLGKVYEFQTAYCAPEDGLQDFIRDFCEKLRAKADSYATPIPILPKIVDLDSVYPYVGSLKNVPVGIGKKNLTVSTVNLEGRVLFPVAMQDLSESVYFVEELHKVLKASCKTFIVDAEQQLSDSDNPDKISGNFESFVQELFNEMVKRNNDYKDANMDASVLNDREELTYIIIGINRLLEQLIPLLEYIPFIFAKTTMENMISGEMLRQRLLYVLRSFR